MKRQDTINFRVGLNGDTASSKFYWDTKWLYACEYGSDHKSAIKNGILYINGFDNPEYTDVYRTFGYKLHGIALAIISFINTFKYENLDIMATSDIEREPAWKAFKKIATEVMIKHKIGKGIKIGGYSQSFVGGFDMFDWEPISKIGKMLNSGELIKVGHADFGSGVCGVLLNIVDDERIVLNEKYIKQILERPMYTVAFINEKPVG